MQERRYGREQVSQTFWGAFSQEYGRSDLVVMQGDKTAKKGGVTAKSYVNVLKEHLPTVLGEGRDIHAR